MANMKDFSQREEQRDDRLLDILTDEENGLRLIVSLLGAELISVARRNAVGDWIGFMNRDNEIARPEKGWANHATVMGYYLSGRSTAAGKSAAAPTVFCAARFGIASNRTATAN